MVRDQDPGQGDPAAIAGPPAGVAADGDPGPGDLAGEPQVAEPQVVARPAEHPDHGPLAERGGERAHPHLQLAHRTPDPPLLGDVGPVPVRRGGDLGGELHPDESERLE